MQSSNNIIPSNLIAVPNYDGYFYDPETEKLYSIKVSGTLTELKVQPAKQVGYMYFPQRFSVSRRGKKSYVTTGALRKLKPAEYCVPYTNPVTP